MWNLSGNQSKQTLKQSCSELEMLVLDHTVALQNLSRRLLRVQDEERHKVARDIHDSTGQTLTALKIELAPPHRNY
jgi:signal transduction histidine kinase